MVESNITKGISEDGGCPSNYNNHTSITKVRTTRVQRITPTQHTMDNIRTTIRVTSRVIIEISSRGNHYNTYSRWRLVSSRIESEGNTDGDRTEMTSNINSITSHHTYHHPKSR